MTEEQTYEQGIQEGVRRAFDFLQSTAANTDDPEKCRILTDVAEEVLEFATDYKTVWLEMEAYRKAVVAGYLADTKNAARYRFLKQRFMGYDFSNLPNITMMFSIPKDIPGGTDCDANVDAGIAAMAKEPAS